MPTSIRRIRSLVTRIPYHLAARIVNKNIFVFNILIIYIAIVIFGVGDVFSEYTEGMEAYRKAWAAYSMQRFDEAQEWARKALRADPQNAHALTLQGDLYYLRQDLTLAKEAWQQAMSLNPQLISLSGQIQQVDAELQLEAQMRPASLGSLTILVPEGLPPEQTQEITQILSQAGDGVAPYFQYRMERPLSVLVYPRQTFYSSTHLPTEVLGLFDGKIRVPISSSQGPEVLWHEYTHAVVYDVSHGKAPRWLQEGLAQVCEKIADGGLRIADLKGSQSEINNPESAIKLPPLRALLGIAEHPGELVTMPAGQFYSASKNLVQYLLKTWGWDRMRLFLKMLGAGQSVEEAIQGVYGWDLDTLEHKWRMNG